VSDPTNDVSQADADLDPEKVPEEEVPAEKVPADRGEQYRDYSRSSDEGENEAEQDADTPERDD
jgi:hypothetical protein